MNFASPIAPDETLENVLQRLRDGTIPADLTSDDGRRFLGRAVASLLPYLGDASRICVRMQNDVLRPNKIEYDTDHVFSTIRDLHKLRLRWLDEQRQKKAAEQRNAAEAHRATRESARAAQRVEVEEKAKRAEENKKIAEELGISLRHARSLRTDGTTSLERAKQLAQILGTEPEDHYRARAIRPSFDFLRLFMEPQIPELSFRDFVQARRDDMFEELIDELNRQRGTKAIDQASIRTLEELVSHVRVTLDERKSDEAIALWSDYKKWRIDEIAARAHYQIEDGERL